MAKFETVVRELTKLRATTRPRSQTETDTKLQLAAFAQGLADIDDSWVVAGCASWALESQWFPTLAELRSECIRHQPKPEKSRATYLPPAREIPERERLRNAYGLRRVNKFLKAGNAAPADWDGLRAEIDEMRRFDSLPPEVADAIG